MISPAQFMPSVAVSGGVFEMGTPAEAVHQLQVHYGIPGVDLFGAETPRHTVVLSPFEIDQYPVTNAHFFEFVSQVPDWLPSRVEPRFHNGRYLAHWINERPPKHLANHPVTCVPWYAALAYARWLGKRLPTEAEWEYVARGGNPMAEFPWGEAPANPMRANYSASGVGSTSPVGIYRPNAFGVFDLAGNAWEYCLDEWQADYYAHSERVDPVAGGRLVLDEWQNVTTRRVIRGGSWGGDPINMRVTYRDSHPPTGAGPHVGFRCAR